jgi:hypothetical protein
MDRDVAVRRLELRPTQWANSRGAFAICMANMGRVFVPWRSPMAQQLRLGRNIFNIPHG